MTPPLHSTLAKVKEAGRSLTSLPSPKVTRVLRDLARALEKGSAAILRANTRDLRRMEERDPRYDRLKLTPDRIQSIASDLRTVARLPSPLHRTLEKRTLRNGLRLLKVTVPLGVVGIIYEARPNVTVDAFTLCFKSGNACVLKGGTDAWHSNRALVGLIQRVLKRHRIDPYAVLLLPPDRAAVTAMLRAHGLIDVVIPRGGQKLIDYVRENATIPVIETGAGVVHTYVDASADTAMAARIIHNEKTRRPSVCNAIDTLLVHRSRLRNLPKMLASLASNRVQIFADSPSYRALHGHYDAKLLKHARPAHYGIEFLSLKMAIKTVASLSEALTHIERYGSRHSESIVARNRQTCEEFLRRVDAACVYANASTTFSDGAQFGMGSEIGISTQKLHARGPMALPELTSTKWIVRGRGHVRP